MTTSTVARVRSESRGIPSSILLMATSARRASSRAHTHLGGSAVAHGELSLDEQAEQAIERTERIHPGQFRKHYDGKAFSIAWHRTRYNEGGWSAWSPPDRQNHLPVLREPQGRIYFAGDYMSSLSGWQVGAIESAWAQIEKVHASVMQA